MSSLRICFVSAKRWSQVVAILQMVFHAANLVFFTATSALEFAKSVKTESATVLTLITLAGVSIALSCLIGFSLGLTLHVGVRDSHVKKIQIWLYCAVGLLTFTVFMQIQDAILNGYKTNGIVFSFGILVHVISIAVVNIHRRELKSLFNPGSYTCTSSAVVTEL